MELMGSCSVSLDGEKIEVGSCCYALVRTQGFHDNPKGQSDNIQYIVHGPYFITLEDGQKAEIIEGHRLLRDEYLFIKIFDEILARHYWKEVQFKPAAGSGTDNEAESLFSSVPKNLACGSEYRIIGTEYSFFIPPNGVIVIPDNEEGYIRKAVTLELYEYTILINENRKHEYHFGNVKPKIVFPMPGQRFVKLNGTDSRKVKAEIVSTPYA